VSKPADYQDVDQRLHEFWERFPDGRLRTKLHQVDERQVVFMAEVFKDAAAPLPTATGWAEERFEGRMKQWALETCETSAIGRALANLGMNPKGLRPSSLEMGKADRQTPAGDGDITPPPLPPNVRPIDVARASLHGKPAPTGDDEAGIDTAQLKADLNGAPPAVRGKVKARLESAGLPTTLPDSLPADKHAEIAGHLAAEMQAAGVPR